MRTLSQELPSRILSLPSIACGGCRSVDPSSIVVSGCSGGGDLALEIAAATDVAAIATEEPATVLVYRSPQHRVSQRRESDTPRKIQHRSLLIPGATTPRSIRSLAREKIREDSQSDLNHSRGPDPDQPFQCRGADTGTTDRREGPGNHHMPRASRTALPSMAAGLVRRDLAAALKAFQDTDMFFRRHLKTDAEAARPWARHARTDHSAIGFSHGLTGAGADGGEQRRNPRHLAPPRSAPRR